MILENVTEMWTEVDTSWLVSKCPVPCALVQHAAFVMQPTDSSCPHVAAVSFLWAFAFMCRSQRLGKEPKDPDQ
jgi:hypothetical protein